MATKKKSTTTKKTPSKASKKSAAAKKKTTAAKKAPSKKTPVTVTRTTAGKTNQNATISTSKTSGSAKSTVKRVATKKDLFAKLNVWHWVLGFIYAAAGIVALNQGSNVYRAVTTDYATANTIIEGGNNVAVTATRTLFDANMTYFVAAILLALAVTHIVRASVARKAYEKRLREGHGLLRWLDFGVIGGLSLVTVGLALGVTNVAAFVAVVLASVVGVLAWRMLEDANHEASRKSVQWTGWYAVRGAAAIPLFVIAASVLSQQRFADVSVDARAYWLLATVFVGYAVRILLLRTFYARRSERTYLQLEWLHVVVHFVMQAAIAGQLFFWLLKK